MSASHFRLLNYSLEELLHSEGPHYSEHEMLAEQAYEWLMRDPTFDCLSRIYPPKWVEDCAKLLKGFSQENKKLETLYVLDKLAASAPRGPAVECGVWKGLSAKILSRHFSNLTLVDSFEGLSAPDDFDAVAGDDSTYIVCGSDFGVDLEQVRREFPSAKIVKGWIPEILGHLPEQKWAFVHLDLDLFKPTFECLSYFKERLMPGGLMVEDQYVSIRFPGAGRAWRGLRMPISLLATGQAIYVEPGRII